MGGIFVAFLLICDFTKKELGMFLRQQTNEN